MMVDNVIDPMTWPAFAQPAYPIAAVFFRDRNAVHMGDLFTPRGYPFVDVDNGGDSDGLIAFCRAVLAELIAGGAALEQVLAAKPTAAWDESYGMPANCIDRVYTSLTR